MSRPAPVPPPLPADPQPVLLDGGSRAWALAAAGLALLPLLLTLPPQLGAGFGVLAPVVALPAWRRPLPGWLRGVLALAVVLAVVAVMAAPGLSDCNPRSGTRSNTTAASRSSRTSSPRISTPCISTDTKALTGTSATASSGAPSAKRKERAKYSTCSVLEKLTAGLLITSPDMGEANTWAIKPSGRCSGKWAPE